MLTVSAMLPRDALAAGATPSAAAASAATAEGNKSRKFSDIPEEALIKVDELHELIEKGGLEKGGDLFVLDIRSHRDYQKTQIEGTRNIPAGRQIDIRINEIPTAKTVVLIALKNTNRLAETYFTLLARGYDAKLLRVLDGGVEAWVAAGYPTLSNQFLGC